MDWTSVEWADPEIEFVIAGGPDPDSWIGVDGTAEGLRQWLSAWDDYTAEADAFREVEERVLAIGQMRGPGKKSGAKVETDFVNVFDFRDGRVVSLRLYSSRERAFADLGLTLEDH